MFRPSIVVSDQAQFEEYVTYHQPTGPGKHTPHRFKLRFAVHPTEEGERILEEFQRLSGDAEELTREQRRAAITDLFARFVVGWPDGEIGDEAGQPLPYSIQALDGLLQVPGLQLTIIETYGRAVTGPGRGKLRRGN